MVIRINKLTSLDFLFQRNKNYTIIFLKYTIFCTHYSALTSEILNILEIEKILSYLFDNLLSVSCVCDDVYNNYNSLRH